MRKYSEVLKCVLPKSNQKQNIDHMYVDTPRRGQARKSAQTAEAFLSLLLLGHGEFHGEQQKSAAFLPASSTLFRVLQATI
jgi:hypothetical protein